MSTVTVSSDYHIQLPPSIREALEIKPGQKLSLIQVGRTVHLVAVRSIEERRGTARGINTDGLRDKRDRDL